MTNDQLLLQPKPQGQCPTGMLELLEKTCVMRNPKLIFNIYFKTTNSLVRLSKASISPHGNKVVFKRHQFNTVNTLG